MSQFGHRFDTGYDPIKDNVYKLFASIYNNCELTKTKESNGISTYMGKSSCLLINECRYLIATVSNDLNDIGTNKNIRDINWTNFQTRTLKGKYDCCIASVLNTTINAPSLILTTRNDKYTQYKSDELKLQVSLLHTKSNNLYEYPNSTDLFAALDNYNTIIVFNS